MDLSDLLDLKVLYKGDGEVDDAALATGRIVINDNSKGSLKIRPKKGESIDFIVSVEAAGDITKIDTSIPIHRVRVEGELRTFATSGSDGAYARRIEAGTLGVVKMAAKPGSGETFYVAIRRAGDGSTTRKANVTLSGVTLTGFEALNQKALITVSTKKKKGGGVYPGAIAPKPGCESQSVIFASELQKVKVSGGDIRPLLIESERTAQTKIQAFWALERDANINPVRILVQSDKLAVETVGGDIMASPGDWGTSQTIRCDGLILRVQAKAKKGDGGRLGALQPIAGGVFGDLVGPAIGESELATWIQSGQEGIKLLRGDEGVNGYFIAGILALTTEGCSATGPIVNMQTKQEGGLNGFAFLDFDAKDKLEKKLNAPAKKKFLGNLKLNECPNAPPTPTP